MALFHFDTETFLIAPGIQAPPMVCLQFVVDDQSPQLVHAKDPALPGIVEWALGHAVSDGHNLAYDAAVICAWRPDFIPLVFQAYRADRLVCTAIRQKLVDIALGQLDGDERNRWGYSLAECAFRANGTLLDKADPWRLKYGTLYGTPVDRWPQDAVDYAIRDATAQRGLYLAQESATPYLEDQFRQSRAAFWLRLMECRGIRTDPQQVEAYRAQVLAESARDQATATAAGLVRLDGTRDTKRAMVKMVEVMSALGEDVTLTEDAGEAARADMAKALGRKVSGLEVWQRYGEYVSLNEDACLASGDKVLQAYQRFGSAKTTLSRVERLRHGTVLPIQSRFDPLKETGRVSCQMGDVKDGESPPAWGFQLQNLPRAPGLHECFIPRPGFWLSTVDYPGMELRTWAQCCIWAVGRSRMAEVLNAGGDPHTELGATLLGVTKAEAYALARGDHGKEYKLQFKEGERQTGKIGNLGFQGGMGAETLRVQARTSYGVNLTAAQSNQVRAAWRMEWPEGPLYFEWVSSLIGRRDFNNPDHTPRGTIKQFRSNRIRGGVTFTEACNTFFQGLAVDVAKDAGFRMAWEMYTGLYWDGRPGRSPLYGSRKVDFIHDEFLLEVPAHLDGAHRAGMRQAEIMVETGREWLPNLAPSLTPELVSPVIMSKRWVKDAETVIRDGIVVPGDLEPARLAA